MRIIVIPRDKLEETIEKVDGTLAIISITNKLEKDIKFSNGRIIGVFRMRYDDEYVSEGCGPKQRNIKGLKDFVDDARKKVDALIIHCAAGLSRSPAVAEAISRYLYEQDEHMYESYSDKVDPNPLVLKLACTGMT